MHVCGFRTSVAWTIHTNTTKGNYCAYEISFSIHLIARVYFLEIIYMFISCRPDNLWLPRIITNRFFRPICFFLCFFCLKLKITRKKNESDVHLPEIGEPFHQLCRIILIEFDIGKVHFEYGWAGISYPEEHQLRFAQVHGWQCWRVHRSQGKHLLFSILIVWLEKYLILLNIYIITIDLNLNYNMLNWVVFCLCCPSFVSINYIRSGGGMEEINLVCISHFWDNRIFK